MPEAILTILKFCFLALLYLFLYRVIRVVYLEMGGRTRRPRRVSDSAPTGVAATAPAAAGPATATAKKAKKRRKGGGPATVTVIAPEPLRGRSWEVGRELTVGRAAACQISLNDDTYVSQMHARIFTRDGEIFVEDLGSTNGTYLNRKKLTSETPARRGDRIQIGKTVLEVSE